MGMQTAWRYCQNCHVMFFDGYADKGHCAAGGGHVAQGYMFALPHDLQEGPTAQSLWRYCEKCHAMFYDGYPQKGACPADGQGHAAQGYLFVLPHDTGATGTAQADWRYCQNCHAMFFDGYADKGRCDAGGGHVAQGYLFVLPHDVPPALDFNFAPIVFSSGIAAGGYAHLALRQDGTYTFSGHFHDSGGAAYKTALAWVVKDLAGQAYTFQHAGSIAGTFESGSRDDNWNINGSSGAIADGWANIAGGAVQRAQANVDTDLTSLLSTVKTAISVAGAVIAVVA
jgi:hypothetical protein